MTQPTDPMLPDDPNKMPGGSSHADGPSRGPDAGTRAPEEERERHRGAEASDGDSANHGEPSATAAGPRSAPSFGRRHWGKLTLAAFIVAPSIVFALWAVVGLNYVYSDGTRAGFVQKISKKGWLCKTWEGEMAISTIPGSMPQLFMFSVRSDSIAAEIVATNGKRIVIAYEEKPWVPTTCFGDTKHFVTGVRVVGNAPEPE